jgi:hypothetical protein
MLVVIRAAFLKGVSAKGKFANQMIFNKRFYRWNPCGIFEGPNHNNGLSFLLKSA